MPGIAGQPLAASISNLPRQSAVRPALLNRYQPRDDVALLMRAAIAPDQHLAVRFQVFLDVLEAGEPLRIGGRRERRNLALLGILRVRMLEIVDDLALAAQHLGLVRNDLFARVDQVAGGAVDGADDRQHPLLQVELVAVVGGKSGEGEVFLVCQFGVTLKDLIGRVGEQRYRTQRKCEDCREPLHWSSPRAFRSLLVRPLFGRRPPDSSRARNESFQSACPSTSPSRPQD
jgi:hypothetical protein